MQGRGHVRPRGLTQNSSPPPVYPRDLPHLGQSVEGSDCVDVIELVQALANQLQQGGRRGRAADQAVELLGRLRPLLFQLPSRRNGFVGRGRATATDYAV